MSQVFFASIIGLYHGYGFTANFIPDYIMTYCKNFVMAFPLQLFIVGPLARLIFRGIFIRTKRAKGTGGIQAEAEEIADRTDQNLAPAK